MYILRTIIILFCITLSSCDNYERINKTERFNKKTGETEILQNDGVWRELREIKQKKAAYKKSEYDKKHQDISDTILKSLAIYGYLDYTDYGYINFSLDNRTPWYINTLTIELSLFSKTTNKLLSKKDIKYPSWPHTSVGEGPYEKEKLLKKDATKLSDNVRWSWKIKSAKGYIP